MKDTKKIEQAITTMVDKAPANITDQASYDEATLFGKQVSKMEKYINTEEKKITRPLNESLKAARALFKPYKERCTQVKNQVKAQMVAYLEAEEAKRKKEEEREMARLERGTMKEETVVKKMVAREESKTDTTGSTMRVLVIESCDFSQVPEEYLLLNESKVKADYRAGKTIQGVTLKYETRARL